MSKRVSPFNSPLETGVRALSILEAAHPNGCDLQRLGSGLTIGARM